MSITPDFGGTGWAPLGTLTGSKSSEAGSSTYFIDKLDFLTPIANPCIAIFPYLIAPSIDNTGNWHYAGKAIITMEIGVATEASRNAVISSETLTLNSFNLIKIPDFQTNYKLSIIVPNWFDEVSYFIYEYLGTGQVSLEAKVDEVYDSITTLISQSSNFVSSSYYFGVVW